MSHSSPILYPQISPIGPSGLPDTSANSAGGPKKTSPGEFDQILGDMLQHVKQPLKFSAHASQRLQERKIALDPETLVKLNKAVDQAEAKGVEDTLIITGDAAYIVNVKNRTVVTALDRGAVSGNVFTNIDGAVLV